MLLKLRTLLLPFFVMAFAFFTNATFAQSTAYADAGLDNPTVTSDKDDYAPGEVAHITGTGWTLDQQVHVEFKETPDYPDYHIYDVDVDADGNWKIDYPIELRHLGVTFTVIVDGKQSNVRAQTIFTDGSVTITAAIGGSAISADDVGGRWTPLSDIKMVESLSGDIDVPAQGGTIILTAPSGFIFDHTNGGAAPFVLLTSPGAAGSNINNLASGSSIAVTVNANGTTLTLNLTDKSKKSGQTQIPNTLTWKNLRVRPTSVSPLANGNITKSGTVTYTALNGVTNYGILTEVTGTIAKFVITGSASQTAGTSQSITITAKNSSGITATAYEGIKSLTFSGASAIGTNNPTVSGVAFSTATAITFAGGVATVPMTLFKTEIATVAATDGVNTAGGSDRLSVEVSAGAASKLAITTQTSATASAGSTLSNLVVTIGDAYGNATTSSAQVSVAVNTGTLNGTTTVTAVNGVATFSDLSINKVGTYTLTVSSTNLAPVTSNNIVISAGIAAKYIVTAGNTNPVVGTNITISAQLVDANNNAVSASKTITWSSTNSGGSFSSPTTNTNASGLATVTFTVSTTADVTDAVTGKDNNNITGTSANITTKAGSAAKLAFGQQPTPTTVPASPNTDIVAGAKFSPAVTVLVQDAYGNTVTTPNVSVGLSIQTNPGGGVLSGGSAISTSNGQASFNDLSINKLGVGYKLAATSSGLTTAISNAFNIKAGASDAAQSTFTPATASLTANGTSTITLTVTTKDALGNAIGVGDADVVITKQSGGGTISSVTDNHNGTYSAVVTSPTTSGSGVFVASLNGTPVNGGASSTITYTAGPIAKLAIVNIADQTAGSAFAVTVIAQDVNGNATNVTAPTTITLSIANGNGTSSSLGGTLTGIISSGNSTVISGVTYTKAENVRITATRTAINGNNVTGTQPTATSNQFAVNPGAASKLVIVAPQPTSGVALSNFAAATHLVVEVQDAYGNLTSSTASMTVAISSGVGTLGGTEIVSALGGTATFSDLSLDKGGLFTLSVSSSGLTSATSGDINISKAPAVITLSDLNPTYDGVVKAVTATTDPIGLSTVTIAYSKNGTPVTAPTNAGSYGVSVTLENDSYKLVDENGADLGAKTGTLVIGKADQTIDFTSVGNKTYGDAPVTLSATAPGGAVSFALVDGPATLSGSTLTITGAGVVKVKAIQGGSSNYNAASDAEQTITVGKASPTISLTVGGPYPYDGDAHTASATIDGVGSDALSTTIVYKDANDNTVINPTNAGSYGVTASFAGNADYNAATNQTGTLVINKVNQIITWATPAAITYGTALSNTQLNAQVAGVAGGSATGTLTYTPAAGTVLSAGTQNLKVDAAETDNYNAASETVSLIVNQATPTVILTLAPSYTYNGEAQGVTTATVTGVGDVTLGQTISYVGVNPTVYAGSSTPPTNAGTYKVTVAFDNNDANYRAASDAKTFTIDKADQTINWTTPTNITYGTALDGTQLNATVAGVTGGSATGTITYMPASGTVLHAGDDQTLKVDVAATANYNAATKTVSLNVAKATPVITLTVGDAVTYDGEAHYVQSATISSVNGDALNTTVTYKDASNAVITAPTNAGNYAVCASFAGNADYNAAIKQLGTLVINKASQRITWTTPAAITYGTALTATQLNASVEGVSGGSPAGSLSYMPVAGTVLDAGTHQALKVDAAETINYNAASATVYINVSKANQTIIWSDPANITYGTALGATQLNAQVAGVSNGSAIGAVTYSPVAGTVLNAGTHQALKVDVAATDNYNAATATVYINVDKANQIITWSNPANITYGTALDATQLNAAVAGVSNGSATGTITYSPAAGTVLNAGTHQALKVDVAQTSNYNAATTTVYIDVDKANQVITWSNPVNIIYGTALSATQLNAQVTGVSGGSVTGIKTYTPTAGTVLHAGNSQALKVDVAATSNYNAATKTVYINVDKATPVITLTVGASVPYDGTAHYVQSVSVSSVNGDVLNATVTYKDASNAVVAAPTNAGSYAVCASFAGNADYNAATNQTGTLVINKANQIITWATPAAITYGTALSNTQLNAQVAGVSGGSATGPLTYTPTAGTVLSAGANQALKVDVAATSNYNAATKTVYINVGQASLTVTVTANQTVQYSDPYTPTGNIAGIQNNDNITITYNSTRTLLSAPGTYPITASLSDNNTGKLSNYAITNAGGTLTVTKEDARAYYTGATYSSTSGTSSTSATVTLSATIKDITAVTGDAAYDASSGDVTKATVTFINADNNTVLAANVPIGLVNTNDKTVGTATANVTLSSGSAGAMQYTIAMKVDGYYTRNNPDDDAVVTVAQPLGDFTTGGGYVILSKGTGLINPKPGTKNNFGFNIKYNKSGTNLQGNINTIVRGSDGKVYQIKGNNMTSLSVSPATASSPAKAIFNGGANIQDITNPAAPISVDGGQTLQVTMTDMGEPGTADGIAITVWNKAGGVWFANNWDGTQTQEQTIAGGNLRINSSASFVGGTVATTVNLTSNSTNNTSTVGQAVTFTAKIVENNSAVPTGTVTFYVDGKAAGSVTATTVSGVTSAVWTTSTLAAGSRDIKAYYGGDKTFTSSASVLTQTVIASPIVNTQRSVTLNTAVPEVTDKKFALTAFPNPTQDQFKVHVESSNTTDKIMLRVLDAYGRTIRLIRDAIAGQTIVLGNEYRPGVYYVEMLQGKARTQVKLLKVVY